MCVCVCVDATSAVICANGVAEPQSYDTAGEDTHIQKNQIGRAPDSKKQKNLNKVKEKKKKKRWSSSKQQRAPVETLSKRRLTFQAPSQSAAFCFRRFSRERRRRWKRHTNLLHFDSGSSLVLRTRPFFCLSLSLQVKINKKTRRERHVISHRHVSHV